MPRVTFVKKARKSYPGTGIKKGDSYYHWKFRRGSIHRSLTAPRRSQLTQSEYLGAMYDLEDRFQDALAVFRDGTDNGDFDTFSGEVRDIAGEVREQGQNCADRRSNMPDQLQDSENGERLQSRSEACDTLADELEVLADTIDSAASEAILPEDEVEEDENLDTDDIAEARAGVVSEAEGVGWEYDP